MNMAVLFYQADTLPSIYSFTCLEFMKDSERGKLLTNGLQLQEMQKQYR